MDDIDPGGRAFVPLCRELAIPKDGGMVFLDLLGVTLSGRLVLIECKLWRNPQARREVIGQLLEYAGLVAQWSYSDLTARLKRILTDQVGAANPIYDRYVAASGDLPEATLHDRIAQGLATGDFDLIVAGDGIREDMHAISHYLPQTAGLAARLTLLECPVWQSDDGSLMVTARPTVRTEVLTRKIIVDSAGHVLELADTDSADGDDVALPTERSLARDAARQFWQRFIDEGHFLHPEQGVARHGGPNWVRVPLPDPLRLTAYRAGNPSRIGAFVTIRRGEAPELIERLSRECDMLALEIGEKVSETEENGKWTLAVAAPLNTFSTEDEQLQWIIGTVDRMTTALRSRLRQGIRSE